jgi:hypothetical protein
MNEKMIQAIEDLVVEQIAEAISSLAISKTTEGWNWKWQKLENESWESENAFFTPFEAFIDFAKSLVEGNLND